MGLVNLKGEREKQDTGYCLRKKENRFTRTKKKINGVSQQNFLFLFFAEKIFLVKF